MEEVGFNDNSWIHAWVDGHYIEPYRTSDGSRHRGIQYHLSEEEFISIVRSNQKVWNAFITGDILFVENHLVYNHWLYVTQDSQSSEFKLTQFARENIELACIPLRVNFIIDVDDQCCYYLFFKSRYHSDISVNPEYEIDHVSDIDRFQASSEQIIDWVRNFPWDRKKALGYCMKKCGYTQMELSNTCGISRQSISEIANHHVDPRLETLLILGEGMKFPSELYAPLLEAYGKTLNLRDDLHFRYHMLITHHSEAGIAVWNQMLIKAKQPPLNFVGLSEDQLKQHFPNINPQELSA